MIDVGQPPQPTKNVTLRFEQITRLLGIEIPKEFAVATLTKLGLNVVETTADSVTATPPSWRKDLTREVDLIEEVGRIYGFDKIPDDRNVPMAASHRLKVDRMLDRVRSVLTSCGFDEAMTTSLVPEVWSEAFSPWTKNPPMVSSQPMKGVLEEYSRNIGSVNLLRRSLVPSLLEARRINEYRNNLDAALFETAVVYLPQPGSKIPEQPLKFACVTGEDYFHLKGVVEMLASAISPRIQLIWQPCENSLFERSKSAEVHVEGKVLGWIGEISQQSCKTFGLRTSATAAELDLGMLEACLDEIPLHRQLSTFPAVSRDFNFVVDNEVRWSQLESTVRDSAGELLESISYRETFRDESKDGEGKKRVLMTVTLRSDSATLTGEEVDHCCGNIVDSCKTQLNAVLLA